MLKLDADRLFYGGDRGQRDRETAQKEGPMAAVSGRVGVVYSFYSTLFEAANFLHDTQF